MLRAEHNGFEFVIEQDKSDVCAYLYVYADGKCVRDELQDDVGICIRSALEGYGVPTVAWREDDEKFDE